MRTRHGRTFRTNVKRLVDVRRSLEDAEHLLIPAHYQVFDPDWSDGSTALSPGGGSGLIAARFMACAFWCYCSIRIVIGTSPTLGSGDWRWTLPRQAIADAGGPGHVGGLEVFDTSVPLYRSGQPLISQGSRTATATIHGVANPVSATSPFTWMPGDTLKFSIFFPTGGV